MRGSVGDGVITADDRSMGMTGPGDGRRVSWAGRFNVEVVGSMIGLHVPCHQSDETLLDKIGMRRRWELLLYV